MNPKWDGIERRKSLREKAEAMVASIFPEKLGAKPAEMLLHELLIHKIELEIQNDELQRMDDALTKARDRYRDIYTFAPTAYIVIDSAECIDEINLAGAALLGITPEQSLKRRFSTFVAAADRDRWSQQFRNLIDLISTESVALSMQMTRADGTRFSAGLNCRRQKLDDLSVVILSLTQVGTS